MDNPFFTNQLQEEAIRRIKVSRKAKDLSQRDMSTALEKFGLRIGASAYAKIERGERALSFVEAMAIFEILEISTADIIPETVNFKDEVYKQVDVLRSQARDLRDKLFNVAVDVRTFDIEALQTTKKLSQLNEEIKDIDTSKLLAELPIEALHKESENLIGALRLGTEFLEDWTHPIFQLQQEEVLKTFKVINPTATDSEDKNPNGND